MRRAARLAGPLVAVLPVPVAAVLILLDAHPGVAALILLMAALTATGLAGAVAGAAAGLLSTFLLAVSFLPPRNMLEVRGSAAVELTVFAATNAAVVVAAGLLRRAGKRAGQARAAAEQRSSVLSDQVALIAPVLDDSPVGFAVFDRDLRYRYLNRAQAAMHGGDAADHLGKRFAEVFPDHVDLLEPYAREVLRTGEAQLDRTVTLPGGRTFRVDRYPIRDPCGTVAGVAFTVQDVTARQRLAEVQAEAERLRATAGVVFKLEAAQRVAGLGSWELDLATRVSTWSRQLQAMLGALRPLTELVAAEDLPRAQDAFDRLLERGEPYRIECRVRRADGSVFEAVCTGQAVPGPHRRPASLWGTVQDVSEQRRAERAARAALEQAAQARARMEAEHRARQLVQTAMLPPCVPAVPGLDLAVAYLPVTTGEEIGGDWYDAFRLPDGRLAIAIGDVTGHDLHAATIMGQVRNGVRAYALLDPDPGLVLAHANELVCALPELDPVTMLFGVYDPVEHTVCWSRAGHPAPLLYRGGDAAVTLDRPLGRLLGAAPGARYPVGRHRLAPGETLLWYTDGLVEHSDRDPARYLGLLRERAVELGPGLSAHRLVTDLTAVLVRGAGQADDVCLLAISPAPATATEPADAAGWAAEQAT